MAVGQPADGRP